MKNEQLTANLVEIFSAIQGEGLNIGTRQIFIRLAKCDLRCLFCDSQHTWEISHSLRREVTPGGRDFQTHPNPVTVANLIDWVSQLNIEGLHDSISITGGEPLLQANFLEIFLPQLKKAVNLPIYLETGGHLPHQLSQILPHLDMVGMDMKLPSVSGEERWYAHKDFLQRCANSDITTFVKLIISQNTDPADLEKAANLVAEVNPEMIVYLQPVTPLEELTHSGEIFAPSPEQVLNWQGEMKRKIKQVLVIPQTHKMIGQL